MSWLLLSLGTSAGVGGLLSLGNARLAIDKIESLLLFLIAAVLITGGAVVRAVNRSRVVLELEEAIRGQPDPHPKLVFGRVRHEMARATGGLEEDEALSVSAPGESPRDDEDEPMKRPRRVVQVLGAAFLAVTVGLLGLWLVVTTATK